MPVNNLAPEMQEFVDNYIDSFVVWDVLAYLHENPQSQLTRRELAQEVGRHPSAIDNQLAGLVEKKLLAVEGSSPEERLYRYSAPGEFRTKMDAFLAATRDRINRLAIVSKVLQKEARRL